MTPVPVLGAAIPAWVKEFGNGRVPTERLVQCAPRLGVEGMLTPEAAAAWHNLTEAFSAGLGVELTATGMYRTFERQVALHNQKPDLAATPGTSNHGWGCAVDAALGVGRRVESITEGSDALEWLAVHEASHGWSHEWHPTPRFPQGGKEPWHLRLVSPSQAFAQPPPPRLGAPDHELRPGMQGPAVAALQNYCRFFGFTAPETTGVYDTATEAAVTAMQAKVCPGQGEVGVYDATTHLGFQVLLDELASAKPPPPPPPAVPDHVLRPGMQGPAVAALQNYCRFFGFTAPETTGVYDTATEAAVTAMQAKVCPGQGETGVYDAITHLGFQVFLDQAIAAASGRP